MRAPLSGLLRCILNQVKRCDKCYVTIACTFTPYFMRRKVLVYADAYAIIFLDSLRKRVRRLHFGCF